jgi:hypothetical protein
MVGVQKVRARMKLIIDIDDEDYKRIQDIPNTFNSLTSRAYSAIRKGTPQQTEQEEAEEKQEEKKVESIEDKTWLNFNSVLSMRSYYEKALEDITKEPIPPCFNSICDPKFLNFVIDGLEDAMAALTMLYKNILERSGTHGE